MSMQAYRGGPTGSNQMKKVGGYNIASLSKLNPEQQDLFSRLMGGSRPGIDAGLGNLNQLASGGSEDFWKQLEAPAMRQFGELQGQTASRFSGQGLGGRRSSAFYNEMGGNAESLAEKLQSQRLGLQQSAIQSLLGIGSSLLGRDTQQSFLQPPKKKWWESLLGAGLPAAGAVAGGVFGGPAGAQLGAQLGGYAGSAFL